MKLFIKISLLLLLPGFAKAQYSEKNLDSLHFALKNAANDTVRMDAYFRLGLFYNEINLDSSLFYLNQSIPIAQKLKLKINEASALDNKGYMLMQLGNYPKSLESSLQALKIAEDPASEKYTWNLPKGRTPRNERLDALGCTHHEMGHLYGATGNTDKQITNYFAAISLAESVPDTVLLASANMDLGNVYLRLNKLDSSLFFEQRALRFNVNLSFDLRKYEGWILTIMGNIYKEKGNFNLAKDVYLKAIKADTEQNNLTVLEDSYIALGALYQTFKKPDSSLLYARKSLETAQGIGQHQGLAKAYQLLLDVFSNRKNLDSTLKYLQLYTALHDSLNDVEKKNLLAYQNIGFDEQIRLQKLEEEKIQTQTKIRTYAMLAALMKK